MKKPVLAAIAAMLAVAALAEPVKMFTVQSADQAGLMQAVTKFGMMTGNPMVGALAGGALSEFTPYDTPEPMREGVPLLYVVYADSEKLAANPTGPFDDVEQALIFAPVRTKEEFVAAHPGCEDLDGVIAIKEKGDEDDDDPDKIYTAFSADGKFAAVADKREMALAALAESAATIAPMDGDTLRFALTKKAFSAIVTMLECAQSAEGSSSSEFMKVNVEVAKMCEDFRFGVRISDKGLDVRGALNLVPGSPLAQCGNVPLSPDAFAAIPATAAIAAVAAQNSGVRNFATTFGAIAALLEANGIAGDYFTCTTEGTSANLTFDWQKASTFFSGPGEEAIEKLDPEKTADEFRKVILEGNTIDATRPATSFSFTLTSAPLTENVGPLFAKLLPEAAEMKAYYAGVTRLYAVLKLGAPAFLELIPESDRAPISAIVSALPPVGDAAIVSALGANGLERTFIWRVSPDELRGLGAIVNSCIGFMGMAAMESMSADSEDGAGAVDADESAAASAEAGHSPTSNED